MELRGAYSVDLVTYRLLVVLSSVAKVLESEWYACNPDTSTRVVSPADPSHECWPLTGWILSSTMILFPWRFH